MGHSVRTETYCSKGRSTLDDICDIAIFHFVNDVKCELKLIQKREEVKIPPNVKPPLEYRICCEGNHRTPV